MPDYTKYYDMGQQARKNGKKLTDNPLPARTKKRSYWTLGWKDQKKVDDFFKNAKIIT